MVLPSSELKCVGRVFFFLEVLHRGDDLAGEWHVTENKSHGPNCILKTDYKFKISVTCFSEYKIPRESKCVGQFWNSAKMRRHPESKQMATMSGKVFPYLLHYDKTKLIRTNRKSPLQVLESKMWPTGNNSSSKNLKFLWNRGRKCSLRKSGQKQRNYETASTRRRIKCLGNYVWKRPQSVNFPFHLSIPSS